ncbi:MAG: alpha-hydroxy-acid oxidizing protein [Pseudomonadota bacterium]|nr:alpha-hydroxy-acid oxidizing protein [Pseudomonadota bacterium]
MANVSFSLRRRPISVESYRRAARRVLPPMAWSYLDGGADDQVTLAANVNAFRRWRLRTRVLAGVSEPDISACIAGIPVALPIALAPLGLTGLMRWDGDIAAARAAEAAGTRLILSTGSSWSLEEVAEATQEHHWFQLYPYGDRRKVGELVARAAAAGYTALFVTVDCPVRGNREGERETGMSIPINITPRAVLDAVIRPRWWWQLLRKQRAAPIHYVQANATGVSAALQGVAAQDRHMQGNLNWDDLQWLRDQWPRRLYVKGVLDAEDAIRSVDTIGAEGVVVSNHGGRQLDRVLASLEALPAVVAAIADRAEVYLDGGVRRGSDIIVALALGAKGVMVGRAYGYALAVGGESAVRDVLAILREDMRRTLILMGCPSAAALDRSWLVAADNSQHRGANK